MSTIGKTILKLRKSNNSEMKRQLKRFIKKTILLFDKDFFDRGKGGQAINFTDASELLEIGYGHLESLRTRSCINGDGEQIPWFTYPSIEYLDQLDLSEKVMLEWGAGNSSIYFSKRVKEIVSIESDREWYEKIREDAIANQELYFAVEDYATKPNTLNRKFDIILIDGIKREECAQQVMGLINNKGLIILDNSDRYPDIASYFRDNGYIQVDFHGFGPINNYTWTTSVFLDREIDLKPISHQPVIPIGGGY